MLSPDLTLVTAFYDLNKLEKRPSDKTKENYMLWAEYLFGLNVNMVYFVSAEDYLYVWSKRKDYGLLDKTFIVKKEFSELLFYNERHEIRQYKEERPIQNSMEDKDSEHYILLTWNKIFFVEETMNMNPFKTNYFGWIDFGIYNVVKDNMPSNIIQTFEQDSSGVRILQLRNVLEEEVNDLYVFTSEFRWKLAGGLFTGDTESMREFITLFKKYLFKLLSMRIFAHEETIFSLTYFYNKHLFKTYYGDYRHILSNYRKITEPNQLIFDNMVTSRLGFDYENALLIAETLYEDCLSKLDVVKRLKVYDEIIMNAFFVDKSIIGEYLVKLLDELKSDNGMYDEFSKDKGRMITNIKYYDNEDNNYSQGFIELFNYVPTSDDE